MTFTQSLCNVSCECGHTAPLEDFTERPVTGPLPEDTFQCPACNRAWKRTKGQRRWSTDIYPPMKIQPVTARL